MSIRLGGPVFEKTDDPEAWVRAVRALGYRAAVCPLSADAPDDVVRPARPGLMDRGDPKPKQRESDGGESERENDDRYQRVSQGDRCRKKRP